MRALRSKIERKSSGSVGAEWPRLVGRRVCVCELSLFVLCVSQTRCCMPYKAGKHAVKRVLATFVHEKANLVSSFYPFGSRVATRKLRYTAGIYTPHSSAMHIFHIII